MGGKCCSGTGNGCSLRCFLVVLMLLTGGATVGVSVFTLLCVPAIKMIENPVWAGGPLILAALLSIVYCCPKRGGRKQKTGEDHVDEEDEDEDSACVFVIKVLCIILLAISFTVCLIGAVFCAVHIFQYYMYTSCEPLPPLDLTETCVCFSSADRDSKRTEYSPVKGCNEVYREVIYTVMASGFLCLIGSWEAMTFIGSIFRSRYGQIHTGS